MRTLMLLATALGLTACPGRLIDVRSDGTAGNAGTAGEGTRESEGSRVAEGGTGGASRGAGGASPTVAEAGAVAQAVAGSTGRGGASSEPGTGEAGSAEDPGPDTSACIASSDLPALVGTWTGDSTEWGPLFVVITGASEVGGVCGTVAFGTDEAPPAPTDPNVGWPPSYRETLDVDVTASPSAPGYPYPITSQGVVGTRALFSIDTKAAWQDWCELQTPIDDTQGDYACLPNTGYSLTAGHCSVGSTAVDCAKVVLCVDSPVCRCQESGCVVMPGDSLSFDLTMGTTSAVGTLSLNSSTENIALTRVAADE